MQNVMIYQALTRLLSPAGAADVLAALRQDAMLWTRLAQPEFLNRWLPPPKMTYSAGTRGRLLSWRWAPS